MAGITDQIGTEIDQINERRAYNIWSCPFSNWQGYEEHDRPNKTAC
jgi:hypothetical protein